MLFEKENLIESEKEIKLQIYVEQLTNDLYRNKKIEVDSKKILELLSYLTSNENISTEMKTAIEYQNRKITDILHKKEVEQLKKYIKYLEQNSAEIKQKNTELAEKNAEIEKLKKVLDEKYIFVAGARTVYDRLMGLDKEDIVKNDLALRNEIYQHIEDNDKKDKIIDLMAEEIKERKYVFTNKTKKDIKQYFERKATNNG